MVLGSKQNKINGKIFRKQSKVLKTAKLKGVPNSFCYVLIFYLDLEHLINSSIDLSISNPFRIGFSVTCAKFTKRERYFVMSVVGVVALLVRCWGRPRLIRLMAI